MSLFWNSVISTCIDYAKPLNKVFDLKYDFFLYKINFLLLALSFNGKIYCILTYELQNTVTEGGVAQEVSGIPPFGGNSSIDVSDVFHVKTNATQIFKFIKIIGQPEYKFLFKFWIFIWFWLFGFMIFFYTFLWVKKYFSLTANATNLYTWSDPLM